MASPTTVLVTSAGASPIAMFQQTQGEATVLVQQAALVDPTSGTPSTIDASGNLFVKLQTGLQNSSGLVTASAIASGASSTLPSATPVTSGKTGTLQHAMFSATQPTLWTLQTVNNAGAATSICSFLTAANETFDLKPGSTDEISTVLSSGTTCTFQVIAQNLSTNENDTANAYASFFWAEN